MNRFKQFSERLDKLIKNFSDELPGGFSLDNEPITLWNSGRYGYKCGKSVLDHMCSDKMCADPDNCDFPKDKVEEVKNLKFDTVDEDIDWITKNGPKPRPIYSEGASSIIDGKNRSIPKYLDHKLGPKLKDYLNKGDSNSENKYTHPLLKNGFKSFSTDEVVEDASTNSTEIGSYEDGRSPHPVYQMNQLMQIEGLGEAARDISESAGKYLSKKDLPRAVGKFSPLITNSRLGKMAEYVDDNLSNEISDAYREHTKSVENRFGKYGRDTMKAGDFIVENLPKLQRFINKTPPVKVMSKFMK